MSESKTVTIKLNLFIRSLTSELVCVVRSRKLTSFQFIPAGAVRPLKMIRSITHSLRFGGPISLILTDGT
ncbi:hypothetical protein GCM10028805_58730 [Spirosoma harenae]